MTYWRNKNMDTKFKKYTNCSEEELVAGAK